MGHNHFYATVVCELPPNEDGRNLAAMIADAAGQFDDKAKVYWHAPDVGRMEE